jgi:hypothetical protein
MASVSAKPSAPISKRAICKAEQQRRPNPTVASTAVGDTDQDVFDMVGNIVAGWRALCGPPGERIIPGWRGRVGEPSQRGQAFAAKEAATLIGDAGFTPHHGRLRTMQGGRPEMSKRCAPFDPKLRPPAP